MSSDRGVLAKLTTYKTVLYGGLILLVGFGSMLLSNIDWVSKHAPLQATVNQLGGLLITIGGLAILWDLRGKRDIMDEVLEKVRIESDISTAGIERVTMKYLNDVEWDDLFKKAKTISVFISYGSSWRNFHWKNLQNFTEVKANKFRLFLPDPNDDPTMAVLAKRYDYSVGKIREEVLNSAREFAKLSQTPGADIRIYYRAGDPTYAAYHFDDNVVVTLYSNKRARDDVPTILVGPGTLQEFFAKDLVAIEKQSTEVPLDTLIGGV